MTADPSDVPPLARRAQAAAAEAGFMLSCTDEVGRLLRTLAASVDGDAAESGTGTGVGAAWIAAGLPPHRRLTTVEREPDRAQAAAAVLAEDARVTVLEGDWTRLQERAPYALLFCDGGGKRAGRDQAVELLAPGGMVVLDDFTPCQGWPPVFEGARDELREWWLTHPALVATEVLVTPAMAVIVATKKRG